MDDQVCPLIANSSGSESDSYSLCKKKMNINRIMRKIWGVYSSTSLKSKRTFQSPCDQTTIENAVKLEESDCKVEKQMSIEDTPKNGVALSDLDIGLYVGKEIDDDLKLKLLKSAWTPDKYYKLPYSLRVKNGKLSKSHLCMHHLINYPCLVYSHVKGGVFCRHCVLFHQNGIGRRPVQAKTLVTEPLKKFDKMFGKDGYVTTHLIRHYHLSASERASNFVAAKENP